MKAIAAVFVVVSLTSLPFVLDLYEHGYAAGGACDFGFGERLQVVQEQAIRASFLEPLPQRVDVDSFVCRGFTDFNVFATLYISNVEARKLVGELEKTFVTQQDGQGFHGYRKTMALAGDVQGLRQAIGFTYIYHLCGLPLLDTRTVSVSIYDDVNMAAMVVFNGFKN